MANTFVKFLSVRTLISILATAHACQMPVSPCTRYSRIPDGYKY